MKKNQPNVFIIDASALAFGDDGDDDGDDEDYIEETPRDRLKRYYTEDDSTYYENLNKRNKGRVDKIEKDIKDIDFHKIPMRFRVLNSEMDVKLKALAVQKIDELSMMTPSSSEYFKLKNWIEYLCKLPIGKYVNLPVNKHTPIAKISSFMDKTRKKFDELVYGHDDAKNQIINLLAKRISNPSSTGIVIGLQGPMGTGKSTMGMALCESLNIPFGFISLAGVNGEPLFVGHSYTYEGSRWGKIADILMTSKCMNPIIYFDELDKISSTGHGEEVANFLIHITDMVQNSKFQDRFFGDIDLDMSKCIFIFSYNNEENLNPILKDRMITIRTKSYTNSDKITLALDYMLPKIYKEFGFLADDIVFEKDIIEQMINYIDEEKGSRNLKRALEEIVGSINLRKLLGLENEFPIKITKELIAKYLLIGKKKNSNTTANMMYI